MKTSEHFYPRFYKSDPTRRIMKCKDKEYPFYIRASFKEGVGVVIVANTFQPRHTCLGAAVESARAPASTQNWLQRTLPAIIAITKDTTPNTIIEAVQLHHGEKINYEAVKKAKKIALNDMLLHSSISLRRFQSTYINALKLKNLGTYVTHLSLDPQTNRFQRVFICPPTSSNSFQQCRQFLAIDGTFMKSAFAQTLLLAVAVDGENHCLPTAWALSLQAWLRETWAFFLIRLKATINTPSTTAAVIGDRDKGLASACGTHLPQVTRVHFIIHSRVPRSYTYTEIRSWHPKPICAKTVAPCTFTVDLFIMKRFVFLFLHQFVYAIYVYDCNVCSRHSSLSTSLYFVFFSYI